MAKRHLRVGWGLAVVAVGACSDGAPTAPHTPVVPVVSSRVSAGDVTESEVLRWNAIARQLVAEHATDPPMASRYYALLSVADWWATDGEDAHSRAIDAASVAILGYAYPDRAAWLAAQLPTPQSLGEQRALEHGRRVAARVLERARADRSDLVWSGDVPAGPGLWYSSIGLPPLRPRWGEVRPWLMSSGSEFRPAPPPVFGSPDYLAALHEVRSISDTRTTEQLRIAEFWADGSGSMTPPGHWNAIAADLIAKRHLPDRRAAYIMALMNMALMDAGIACWDGKYRYWLIRPPQADPRITTPVGLPNFPSYVSGHATFSGAASEVLARFFPDETANLRAMAEEAAMSRLYAGIHYRFDNEAGLAMGRSVGSLAVRLIDTGAPVQ